MARYRFKAASPSGEVLEGELEAASQAEVVRRLHAQGQVPILAEEAAPDPVARPGRRLWPAGTRAAEVGVFTMQLAALLDSGLALDQALDMLARMLPDRAFRQVVEDLRSHVRRGVDLSAAMEKHPKLFSRWYVAMVRAGELSGTLDESLACLAEALEHARSLRETLISALIYPAVLLVFAGLSLGVILGVVIPRLSALFAETGQALPPLTQAVVFLGAAVHDLWWAIGAVLAAAWLGLRWLFRRPAVRARWDRLLLGLPLTGRFIAKYEAARFTRVLGTLVRGGVSLLEAFENARGVVGNRAVESGLGRVAGNVRKGRGFARPLREATVFPRLVTDLLQVGEETGNLEAMLLRVADIYDRETRSSVKRMVDILGPLLILVLAALIGAIVMSVLVAVLGVNELAF